MANMPGAKAYSTPMTTNSSLSLLDGHSISNVSEYRQLAGSIQYLSLTRPDVTFAINKLSQFMHRPTDVHWAAVKRVLRYLKGTSSLGLFLKDNHL